MSPINNQFAGQSFIPTSKGYLYSISVRMESPSTNGEINMTLHDGFPSLVGGNGTVIASATGKSGTGEAGLVFTFVPNNTLATSGELLY